MKTNRQDISSVSGYLTDGFEGVSEKFTQMELLPVHGDHVLARAKRYGRWYMLKGLTPERQGQLVYQEMLRKEFDILMQLQHPGVVQAVDLIDVSPIGTCIVMEWVDGVTLDRWLEDEPKNSSRREVLLGLLDTVAYVHAHNIVHRDIKPSNIMITNNAHNVKLIDFSLADTDAHAMLKQPAGTAGYIAPEQASSAIPDVRNDIYSLGMVMRDLGLGHAFSKAANKCLRPIDERYQSIASLQHDLQRRSAIQHWMRIGAVTILVMAALATLWTMSMHVPASGNSHLVDSLRNELSANNERLKASDEFQRQMEASMRERLTTLNDSLSILATSNQQLQNEKDSRAARQRKVDAAIVEGICRVDAANAQTHLKEHLDTVSRFDYIWVDWRSLCRQGRVAANIYLQSIHSQFDIKEMAEIEYAVYEHCNRYEAMIKKAIGGYLPPP